MMRAQEGLPKPWKRPLRAHRPAKKEHRGQVKPRGNGSGRQNIGFEWSNVFSQIIADTEQEKKVGLGLKQRSAKPTNPFWSILVPKKSGPFSHFGPKKRCPKPPLPAAPARISTSLVAPSPGARDASTLQPAVSRRPTTRHREGERSAVSTLERIWGVGTRWDHGSSGSTESYPGLILSWNGVISPASAMFWADVRMRHCVSSSKGDKQHISHKYGDVLETNDD